MRCLFVICDQILTLGSVLAVMPASPFPPASVRAIFASLPSDENSSLITFFFFKCKKDLPCSLSHQGLWGRKHLSFSCLICRHFCALYLSSLPCGLWSLVWEELQLSAFLLWGSCCGCGGYVQGGVAGYCWVSLDFNSRSYVIPPLPSQPLCLHLFCCSSMFP